MFVGPNFWGGVTWRQMSSPALFLHISAVQSHDWCPKLELLTNICHTVYTIKSICHIKIARIDLALWTFNTKYTLSQGKFVS